MNDCCSLWAPLMLLLLLLLLLHCRYDFAAQVDAANAVALRAEGIRVLRMAQAICPTSADVQSSLAEHLFESGKLQSGEGRAAALAAAAAAYESALELAAPETDAVSSYNLLCSRLLLHDGGASAAGGGLRALLETAAVAAAAENGGGSSKEGAVAELKEELREDADLESIATAPFFLAFTSA